MNLKQIYDLLDDQNYNITFSPTENENDFMMYCNNNFIGGIFDSKICYIYDEILVNELDNIDIVFYGYSKKNPHKMIAIPEEKANDLLRILYDKYYDYSRFEYDIADMISSYSHYPEEMAKFYDENMIFLAFCYDNGLLKERPFDIKDRLVRLSYYRKDLTDKGKKYFVLLLHKYLTFLDRDGKSDKNRMLTKWLKELCEEDEL